MSAIHQKERARQVLENIRIEMERGSVYQGSGERVWGRQACQVTFTFFNELSQIYKELTGSLTWAEIMEFEDLRRQCLSGMPKYFRNTYAKSSRIDSRSCLEEFCL